jgi:hypothetical protein
LSTLIALKLNDAAVLATDGRITDVTGKRVISDVYPKITEIAPGTFYGWTGHANLAMPQASIAAELAANSAITDIRAFADALDARCRPLMEQLISTITEVRHVRPTYEDQLTGVLPFHAYVLAGVSEGCPGFLAREFRLVNGEITHEENYSFRLPAGNNFSAFAMPGDPLTGLINDPNTWAGGVVAAAERLVNHLREIQSLVGGPTQLVRIDQSGARWIHKPNGSALAGPAVGNISGNSGNITGTLNVSQLGTGTLPVGVVYAGTVLCSQIGSGTLPVGVVYAGTLAVDNITGWSGATITLGSNDLSFSGSGGCNFGNPDPPFDHAYADCSGFTAGGRGAGFKLAHTGLYYGNTKIVGPQGAAIANGSDATVNAILGALRAHGLIAT